MQAKEIPDVRAEVLVNGIRWFFSDMSIQMNDKMSKLLENCIVWQKYKCLNFLEIVTMKDHGN